MKERRNSHPVPLEGQLRRKVTPIVVDYSGLACMKHCKVGGGHKDLLTVDANRSEPQTIMHVLQVAMLDFHGVCWPLPLLVAQATFRQDQASSVIQNKCPEVAFMRLAKSLFCALLHEQRFVLSGARLKEMLRQCLDERRTFFVLLHKYGIQALLEEGRFAAVAVCDEHAEDSWAHLVLGFLRVKKAVQFPMTDPAGHSEGERGWKFARDTCLLGELAGYCQEKKEAASKRLELCSKHLG